MGISGISLVLAVGLLGISLVLRGFGSDMLFFTRPELLSGDSVFPGQAVWAETPLPCPPPSLPAPALAWPKLLAGLGRLRGPLVP